MLDVLAISIIFTTIILTFDKHVRLQKQYKVVWIPLTVISLLVMFYGYFLSNLTTDYSYTTKEYAQDIRYKDYTIVKVVEMRCIKNTFIHRENNFMLLDVLDGNIFAKEQEIVEPTICKEVLKK